MDNKCSLTGALNGDNVATFYPDNEKQRCVAASFPSFAFETPLPCLGPVSNSHDFPVKPKFITSPSFAVELETPHGTSFYGAGEIPGRLLLNGRKIVTWNTDFSYNSSCDRAYQSHPYILAVRPDGTSFGAIFDSTFKLILDFSRCPAPSSAPLPPSLKTNKNDHSPYTFRVESDFDRKNGGTPFSVTIFERDTPEEVVMTLAELTGKIAMPPKWSLGYHQCRWSYYPDTQVIDIADEFRAREIPCDVMWMDIHYMENYKIFTFSPKDFPNPKKLNDYLHSKGFKSVWMIDPGVKQEEGYRIHDECVEKDLCVKDENGKDFVGKVWPGNCVFPDFTMEKTREWWGGLYKEFLDKGVDGVWNDMNEPAVFDTPGFTMPLTNVHRGFSSQSEKGTEKREGGQGNHAQFHNVYGMLMIKASREGILKARPEKRPFVLSRSNYLGGQKYGATWTGDNTSDWSHLHMSISMTLNLGLSGQPFAGPDIGGFNGTATPDLFARWMGFGALLPFARAHTHEETVNHEPWSFGTETEQTCRIAISRRYMLLAYIYTLFHESHKTGMPVMRPLFFADPKDLALRDEDRAFLLGKDLMVVVDVLEPGKETSPLIPENTPIALPKNEKWTRIDLDGHSSYVKNLPTLKMRRGAIIPIISSAAAKSPVKGGDVQNVGDISSDEMTLLVALDSHGNANGVLYEDEGDGYAFEKNMFAKVNFSANQNKNNNTININIHKTGEYSNQFNPKYKIRIVHQNGTEDVYDVGRQHNHNSNSSNGFTFTVTPPQAFAN